LSADNKVCAAGIVEICVFTTPQHSDEEPLWIDHHMPAAGTSHITSEPLAYNQVVMAVPVSPRTENTTTGHESEGANRSVGRPRAHGRTNMTENERRRFLEEDEWVARVEPGSVTCGACNMTILLDQRRGKYGRRGRYYPGPWMKHRRRCQEIERLDALAMEVTSNLPSGHR
jgi:hypothetical protein